MSYLGEHFSRECIRLNEYTSEEVASELYFEPLATLVVAVMISAGYMAFRRGSIAVAILLEAYMGSNMISAKILTRRSIIAASKLPRASHDALRAELGNELPNMPPMPPFDNLAPE